MKNIIKIQKLITVIITMMTTIKVLVMIIVIEVVVEVIVLLTQTFLKLTVNKHSCSA